MKVHANPDEPREIPKENWSLVFTDSEETVAEDGRAVNVFDNNPNTFWHTKWQGHPDPYPPHEVQIDLGSRYEMNQFSYLPRQDNSDHGMIKEYEIYISDDLTDWGTPVASGSFNFDKEEKVIEISPETGRYLKLVALSEKHGQPWTSAAEISVWGINATSK
ncbi:discoidin domain-containing protein [Mechercharimyces sp. CAU 1602]|uniref:discoidin domain-containing protein n=1 Tax=Mechercharimyces sp. CAU 1602 TaxID=2973933 RepID=UPI0037C62202